MICHACNREMAYKGIESKGDLVYLCPCGRVEVKEKKKERGRHAMGLILAFTGTNREFKKWLKLNAENLREIYKVAK